MASGAGDPPNRVGNQVIRRASWGTWYIVAMTMTSLWLPGQAHIEAADYRTRPGFTESVSMSGTFPHPPSIQMSALRDDDSHNTMAERWLHDFNAAYRRVLHTASLLDWAYNTNISEEAAAHQSEFGMWRTEYMRPWRAQARLFRLDPLPGPLARQLAMIQRSSSHIEPSKSRELLELHAELQAEYNAGRVCAINGTCLTGEPDLTRLMASERSAPHLLWMWKAWRDAVGPRMRVPYLRFVGLQNQLARSSGREDMGAVWRHELDMEELEQQCERLYGQIRPLYQQLHAYVRRKLAKYYGDSAVPRRGPIPAHLLGNMWAQQWDSIMDIASPYPKFPPPDVTEEMRRLNYTASAMFRLAEDFFLSLGLPPMTAEFWERSMLVRPTDGRDVACHGAATNFFDGRDYRIRMCSQVSQDDLATIHHEMGHVQYYMAYSRQPVLLQDSANSAFHEAVGDTVQYSLLAPLHMHHVGLLPNLPDTPEEDINFLFKQALMKLPLIPFSLVIDKWRWELFREEIDDTNANQRWWQLREEYQGVKSPIKRTENDFDPGAKFHIPDNTPYIRYFVSSFLQVQFHRALCDEAHRDDPERRPPLHRCSIYGSKRAGRLLRSVLELGTSRPWQEAMEMITGQREVLADGILEYYEPLHRWLKHENEKSGETVGW